MEDDVSVRESLEKIRNKLLVMSGKGGVGKTSVSVNLSLALAARGFKVGLMDVDIHGPDIPRMLGLSGMIGIDENQKMVPMSYSENLKVVSIESLISDKDQAIIWRGPKKNAAIKQFIGDVAWGELDYLIIDSPPGTGDEPLTVAQTIPDAKAIIVTTPQEISLADVRKSINFCKALSIEIFGIIENMSGFTCPNCGTMVYLFGSGGGEHMSQSFEIPFLGKIPFDTRMVLCADSGTSFQEKFADAQVAKVFIELAEKIAGKNSNIRRTHQMKFAIPTENGKLTAHFGHCIEFALLDVENNKIVKKEIAVPPPHEPGVLPKWLGQLKVNVVIAGGMGPRAVDLLKEQGIIVIIGAPIETPETLVMSYLNKTLDGGKNLCDGGDHHNCGGH
ncbi:MAG: hypothetical protein BWK80_06355 [Desulfobacteraceae bacterium IS3]|nr:MAG: hypothetical protein BWK80_06355 [Desulfobacteraceae bacterium IS3]